MIGLIAKPSEMDVAREFFELFKTPWESYVSGHSYEVVITTTGEMPIIPKSAVIVAYSSGSIATDTTLGITISAAGANRWVAFEGTAFPLYGDVGVLRGESAGEVVLRSRGTSDIIASEVSRSSRAIVRVGYDLFREIGILLSRGQPPENADVPTLELHIALLRGIMRRAGVPFVEILPTPAGYDFMACLSHDVDFTGIREHKGDSTMWGFLYRALFGSFASAMQGKLSWSKCWINWKAAFSLPLVHLGWKDDFWLEFDRYTEIEKDFGSTFFFIPSKNYPGTQRSSPVPKRRAAKYDVANLRTEIQKLRRNGCEIGLHGVDAWQNSDRARRERDKICEIAGDAEIGVRMHWLYLDEDSPRALEEAGLLYDSTFGYNNAVGFRGGTAQTFRMPPAESLLELPLIIQDTALFYPGRMNLSEAEAMESCKRIVRQTARFGGVITVNWHTRSLSPERLWGDFYRRLLDEMQQFRVWFATGKQLVNWFRGRRALRVEEARVAEDEIRLRVIGPLVKMEPPVILRVYNADLSSSAEASPHSTFLDIPWKGEPELTIVREAHARV